MKLAIRIFVGVAVALFVLCLPALLIMGPEFGTSIPPAATAVVFLPAMVWLWRLSGRPPAARPRFTIAALVIVGMLGAASGAFVTMLFIEVSIGMAKGDRLQRIEAPAR